MLDGAAGTGSNLRPSSYREDALPTELQQRNVLGDDLVFPAARAQRPSHAASRRSFPNARAGRYAGVGRPNPEALWQ